MSSLLIQNAYGPKSNKAVTPEAVLKEAKETAAKETVATGATITPAFTEQSETQKEADCCNMAAQAMIGATKELSKPSQRYLKPTSQTACYKPATEISKA